MSPRPYSLHDPMREHGILTAMHVGLSQGLKIKDGNLGDGTQPGQRGLQNPEESSGLRYDH